MDYLTDEHINRLLNKEWLVKSDDVNSIPYLFKFYASSIDQSCCVMITDTKQTWGEVLSKRHLSRRWSDCNPEHPSPSTQFDGAEDTWRSQILDLVSAVHTIGAIVDISFEVVESRNADLAFELGCGEFKWRWETFSLGPKISAGVISQHLIVPLISMSHLAFGSADPVSELSAQDLETAVDKSARTARRSMDTHVRHALTKPRVATSISRLSAVLNFIPDTPAVLTEVSAPKLELPTEFGPTSIEENRPLSVVASSRDIRGENTIKALDNEPPAKSTMPPLRSPPSPSPPKLDEDSVTEAESDEEQKPQQRFTEDNRKASSPELPVGGTTDRSLVPKPSLESSQNQGVQPAMGESSDSSPVRPKKKSKRMESSSDEEDSESDDRRRLAQRRNATTSRGTKQPIKRGARRF